MTLPPSLFQLLCAFAVCLAFAILFFALGAFWERDRRERAKRESARQDRLDHARAHRELQGILGERDWFAGLVDLEKRRGVRRVTGLGGRGVA